MLVTGNLLHSHYIQHVMYVITYPLHAFEDANGRVVPVTAAYSGPLRLRLASIIIHCQVVRSSGIIRPGRAESFRVAWSRARRGNLAMPPA